MGEYVVPIGFGAVGYGKPYWHDKKDKSTRNTKD
jgi:hypothetical protein